MKRIIIVTAAVALTACANTTGVVPMGQGTYTTTVEHRGFNATMGDAKNVVLKQADEFCKDKGGDFHVINSTETPRGLLQPPNASLQFRCVNK